MQPIQTQRHYFPEAELLELEQTLRKKNVTSAVVGHFHRDGKVGIIQILENFTEGQYTVGVYESGKGIRILPVHELFGAME